MTGGVFNATGAPCSRPLSVYSFYCLSVCSSSCLIAVTPVLLVPTIQAVVDGSKWILLPPFPFHNTDSADEVSGQPCSPSFLPICYTSATEDQACMDLVMHMPFFTFLSPRWLNNVRGEIWDHWNILSSANTSFASSFVLLFFSFWSQSRGSETFFSSWCVWLKWNNLGVNQSPTTPQTSGGRSELIYQGLDILVNGEMSAPTFGIDKISARENWWS